MFAVEGDALQLTWRGSPMEDLRIEVGDAIVQPTSTPPAELALSPMFPRRGRPHGSRCAGAGLGTSPAVAGEVPGPLPARTKPGALGTGWWAALASRSPMVASRRRLDPAWPAGPGAVTVEGLDPGINYDVIASAEGVPRFLAARARTLRQPQGRLLAQFATVSDVHVGEKHFGVMGRIQDAVRGRADGEGVTFPERALEAAIAEAAAWGAELLVVKGDLTRVTVPAEVRDVGRLLARSPMPVEVMLGNHDNKLGVDVHSVLQSTGHEVPWLPRYRDIPGLRLIMANTNEADPRYHRGHLAPEITRRLVDMAADAAAAGRPVWFGLHHPPERHPYPTVYPPGAPYGESRVFLSMLAAAQPASLVSCGHRHRNRRYDFGPVVISEVGSTKDYPGVWAGYRVFEDGITQVVRRTARPDVIAWTEATRRAVNGQWGRWSPGTLRDRCFAVEWGDR